MVGVIGRFVFYFSGFGVTVFGPFFFAAHHPDAPVSRPILWLLQSVGPQAFVCIYFFTTVALAFILLLGTEVYDYLQYKRAAQPGASPNGGPATRSGNSGVGEGPPSVS